MYVSMPSSLLVFLHAIRICDKSPHHFFVSKAHPYPSMHHGTYASMPSSVFVCLHAFRSYGNSPIIPL